MDWTCPLITPKMKGFPSGFPMNKIFPERHLNPKNDIIESLYVPHMWVIPSLSFASGNSLGSVLNLSSTPKWSSKLMKNFSPSLFKNKSFLKKSSYSIWNPLIISFVSSVITFNF